MNSMYVIMTICNFGGGRWWGCVLCIMLVSCWLIVSIVGPCELIVLLVDNGVTPLIGLKIEKMCMQINNPYIFIFHYAPC